jgi:hypothetical protein
MDSDTDNAFPICEIVVEQGYVLPGFIKSAAARNQATLIFENNRVRAVNSSIDDNMVKDDYLDGDEINLTWNQNIPIEHRRLIIIFDAQAIGDVVGKILKKDNASLVISHRLTPDKQTMFWEPDSNNAAVVTVVRIGSTREGSQDSDVSIMKEYIPKMVIDPVKGPHHKVVINPKEFVSAMKSYKKNKGPVYFTFYHQNEYTGVYVYSEMEKKCDKLGILPPKSLNALLAMKDDPNTFVLVNSVELSILTKITFHPDGNVKIIYSPGHYLLISRKTGAVGEQNVYILNGAVDKSLVSSQVYL